MREIDEKLWLAVLNREENNIRQCLQQGADPLSINDHKITIAHLAAKENIESALKILLDFTENKILEAKAGEDELTLLTFAVAGGHENIIRLLLARGANIEAKGKSESTPLVEAIGQGRLNIIKLLVDNGVNVNAISDDSRPLELAIVLGNPEIIKILIDAQADLEAKDLNGKTALLKAVDDENMPIVKLLLEHGANINTQADKGQAPLHIAAKKGNITILQLLLTKKATIDIQTADGATPLFFATATNIDCVDLLLKNGADPNANSRFGTPFAQAVLSGNEKLIHLFLNTGKIDPDTVTIMLYEAIAKKHGGVVKLLLESGADPDAKNVVSANPTGRTPLHEAIDSKFEPIVKLLLERNANPLLLDNDGKTAKDLAAEKKLRDISKLIEKKCKQMNFSSFSTSQNVSTLFKPPAPPSQPRTKHNLETDQLIERSPTDSKCCVII